MGSKSCSSTGLCYTFYKSLTARSVRARPIEERFALPQAMGLRGNKGAKRPELPVR